MEEKHFNSWTDFENEIKDLEQLHKEKSKQRLERHNYCLEGNLIRAGNWKQLGNGIARTRHNYLTTTN